MSEDFDPIAAAEAASPTPARLSDSPSATPLAGRDARRSLAGLSGARATPEPAYLIYEDLLAREDFAPLKTAIDAWEEAVRRREDAQLAYEDAEVAYPAALREWERAQAEAASKVAAGGKMPTKLDPRPTPAAFEAKADLLARVAGEAVKAEARAVADVNEAAVPFLGEIASHAAKVNAEAPTPAREALAQLRASLTSLSAVRADSYRASRDAVAAMLAERAGKPSRDARGRTQLVRDADNWLSGDRATRPRGLFSVPPPTTAQVMQAIDTIAAHIEDQAESDFSLPLDPDSPYAPSSILGEAKLREEYQAARRAEARYMDPSLR